MLSTIILGDGEWSHEEVGILEEYLWDGNDGSCVEARNIVGGNAVKSSVCSTFRTAPPVFHSSQVEPIRYGCEQQQNQDPSLLLMERWNQLLANTKSLDHQYLASTFFVTNDTGSVAALPNDPRSCVVVSPVSSEAFSMDDASGRSSSTMQLEPTLQSLQKLPSFPMAPLCGSSSNRYSLAPTMMTNGSAGSYFTSQYGTQAQVLPMATMMSLNESNSMFALLNGPAEDLEPRHMPSSLPNSGNPSCNAPIQTTTEIAVPDFYSTPLLASFQATAGVKRAGVFTDDHEEEQQRKRACYFAKKSRDKKRLEMEFLKEEFLQLKKENIELQDLIQNHFPLKEKRAILNECTSSSQIPQEVLDACRPDSAQDDEEEVAHRVSFVKELLNNRNKHVALN